MSKKEEKERVALFRFGVIAPFLGVKRESRGQKERLIGEVTSKTWEIPGSTRSSVSRSTVLLWLKRYKESGGKLESLYPGIRSDRGKGRVLDEETEQTLIRLKKELKGASVPVILKVGFQRNLLSPDFKASAPSIYRMFKRYGLDREEGEKRDRRRFEAEFPNDLWQSDCMHGPAAVVEGKLRKVFLFGFIDDHSRLIPHARFYPRENLEFYLQGLEQALLKRGIPRKLYVDNGPSFRSHHLAHVAASLGIALIHARPYHPEGKGKIERWHRTVRGSFLSSLPPGLTLDQLNDRLERWIDREYHLKSHSSTGESPLKRYQRHLKGIRSAPDHLRDYFRKSAVRKVDRDRTVSLNGRVYEAPVKLIGKSVTLLYHEESPLQVEILCREESWGFLTPLNPLINSRIKREGQGREKKGTEDTDNPPEPSPPLRGGKLFERREP